MTDPDAILADPQGRPPKRRGRPFGCGQAIRSLRQVARSKHLRALYAAQRRLMASLAFLALGTIFAASRNCAAGKRRKLPKIVRPLSAKDTKPAPEERQWMRGQFAWLRHSMNSRFRVGAAGILKARA